MLILSQVTLRFTPEKGKQTMRVVCSVALLLTMLVPLKNGFLGLETVGETVKHYLVGEEKTPKENDPYASSAATLFAYLGERFDGSCDKGSITFVTDENGDIAEIQLFLPNAEKRVTLDIKEELETALGVTVNVFGKAELSGKGGENG